MGSWSPGHDRDHLVFRGQVDRETFSRGWFWILLGHRIGYWMAAGAPILLFWIPMRLFGSRPATSAWAIVDYAAGGILVVFPIAFFWYWRWFYGRLTPEQRTLEVALDPWGLRMGGGSGQVVEVPWEDIVRCDEGKSAFYLATAKGRWLMLPKGAAEAEVRSFVAARASLRKKRSRLLGGRRTSGCS